MVEVVGCGKKEVEEFFEKEYKAGLSQDEAIALAIKALKKSGDLTIKPDTLEIAVATMKKKEFAILTQKEVEKYLK